MKKIFAKKQGMTQIFDDQGRVSPGTVVSLLPMVVIGHKRKAKDGYSALVVTFDSCSKKVLNKPRLGQLKAIIDEKDNQAWRCIREISLPEEELDQWPVSKEISGDSFTEGDKIVVSGTSKGKGFQGVVKRHNFAGGPRTHGQKHSEREPGSIGAGGVQRVMKGKRMAGRMGSDRVTIKNLKVVKIDSKNKEMFIEGSVPGRRGTLLEISI